MQEADCVHGKDWNLSQKKEKERKQKSMVKVAWVMPTNGYSVISGRMFFFSLNKSCIENLKGTCKGDYL